MSNMPFLPQFFQHAFRFIEGCYQASFFRWDLHKGGAEQERCDTSSLEDRAVMMPLTFLETSRAETSLGLHFVTPGMY